MHGGLGLVLLSAPDFGSSGPFAMALLDAGWSPGAAALVRITDAGFLRPTRTVWR